MEIQASETIQYPLLMLAHMVCADEQIHSEESRALLDLAQKVRAGKHTLLEMEKILSQDEHRLSLEEVAQKIPVGQHSETMRQILAIACVDGFFSPLERNVVEQMAWLWHWSDEDVQRLIEEAEGFDASHEEKTKKQDQKLSFGARFLKGAESILSRALVDKLAEIAPENVGQKVEQLRREILLSGPEYDEAIAQCAHIAKEDYQYAEKALKHTLSVLSDLGSNINKYIAEVKRTTTGKGQANTAKEVIQQLETTKNALNAEIIKEIESVRESLRAKQRALNHFSIAFMGRTKAGKSTLHAVVTGEGWDAIGVGKQRTTRYNRVYEWKNIRIIDTPGIGAPGGKTDEQIAQSIIDESDVICYVVTNDSIQESEFNFLKVLKEKAKPLIVLLNVKYNLRDPRRLEHFLKNPEKQFAMEGKNGLQGHIKRIRRYAREHYANDYFEIIPVMLLAAQLAREPEHQESRDKLFQASRLQDFLDTIRLSLLEDGKIRRSQTLLGSTVGIVEHPSQWIANQSLAYTSLVGTLKEKRHGIEASIQQAKNDSQVFLVQEIDKIFRDVFDAIPGFAENCWDFKQLDLNQAWEKNIETLKIVQRLENSCTLAGEQFSQDLKDALEEVGNELNLIYRLGKKNFQFQEQDSDMFARDLLKYGAILVGIISAVILPFTSVPMLVAGIAGAATTVMSLLSNFFESRDKKRSTATQKIQESLDSQVTKWKEGVLKSAQENLDKHCSSVAKSVDVYLSALIAGLEQFADSLKLARSKSEKSTLYLNKAYAKRIMDWCKEAYEPLSDRTINQTIARVEREFGKSMKIVLKSPCSVVKNSEKRKRVLQEDVSIKVLKKS